MDLKIYAANASEFEHEVSQLREIAKTLKEAEPANSPIYMVTNILLGNKELDCLLLTEKGPIIIDCKAYQGKITGCENGTWSVQTPDGKIVEMNNNPFEQSKNQRFTFLRKWRNIVDKHFTKQIPENQILFFCNWLYFKPGSEHIDDRFEYSKVRKWFKVVTKDNLIESMEKLNHQYRISQAGFDKILHEIGLDASKPIDDLPDPDDSEKPEIILPIKEIQTTSGPIPLIIHRGVIQIVIPSRTKSRTPEFLNAYNEAVIFFEMEKYDRALNLIEFALKKDKYDPDAQDLKYDILCLLGREDEAEKYLINAVKN